MNKRIFSLICVLAFVLVFVFTAQTASISWIAGAEDTTAATSKKPSQEEPYNEPSTSATTTTQPPMPTTSTTTKKEEDSTTKPTEPSTDPTNPTNPTQPTDKPPVSEQPGTTNQEPPSEKDTTKAPDNSTTTKKGDKSTTTKRYVPTTTKRATPHMSIPVVENTTIEGTTLSPLDAYFERISGDTNTFETTLLEESQTQPELEEKEHKPISTIALVAICLGGIALVTVALTAAFAIRNKHTDDADDAAAEYEKDAYDGGEYEQPEPDQAKQARPQVDESDSFTVVSLDDNDYTD